jgi:putative redox protein
MAHANASIGTTNYSVAIMAGHHPLNADESVELGGKDSGPSPFELACAALCACTAITLRMYAQRKGRPLRATHVDADLKWQDKKGVLARTLRFEGELNDDQRARLADIAERTPVTLMLKQGLTVTTTEMPHA